VSSGHGAGTAGACTTVATRMLAFIPIFYASVLLLYFAALRALAQLYGLDPVGWPVGALSECTLLHSSLGLGVVAYTRVVFTSPGSARYGSGVASDGDGSRFCPVCQCSKTERVHHCTAAGSCVLRLDHWCGWAHTAVGARNHKYFLLWQAYQLLSSAIIFKLATAALSVCFVQLHGQDRQTEERPTPALVVTFTLAAMGSGCTFALPAFFIVGHARRACRNLTAVEEKQWQPLWHKAAASSHDRDASRFGFFSWLAHARQVSAGGAHQYDTGCVLGNLTRVLGENLCSWALPVAPIPDPIVVACAPGAAVRRAAWASLHARYGTSW
jgi:hypothetical protein